jgi:hypothetical protein
MAEKRVKIAMNERKNENDGASVILCTLTNSPCKYADLRYADEGVYENCRLCDVYEDEYFKLSRE